MLSDAGDASTRPAVRASRASCLVVAQLPNWQFSVAALAAEPPPASAESRRFPDVPRRLLRAITGLVHSPMSPQRRARDQGHKTGEQRGLTDRFVQDSDLTPKDRGKHRVSGGHDDVDPALMQALDEAVGKLAGP
jgi:hypothetical protein